MAPRGRDKEYSRRPARTLLTVGQYLMVGFALVHHDSARSFYSRTPDRIPVVFTHVR